MRKKKGRLIGEEKQALHKKIFDVSNCVFIWYCEKNTFLSEKYFLEPKVLNECSGYHFYYVLVSCDKYVNKYF